MEVRELKIPKTILRGTIDAQCELGYVLSFLVFHHKIIQRHKNMDQIPSLFGNFIAFTDLFKLSWFH